MLVAMRPTALLPAQPEGGSLVSWPIPLAVGVLMIFCVMDALPQASAESSTASATAPSLKIDALGKGAVPLYGAWQFHAGDNLNWAKPETDDTTGHDGWEQLTADAPWGTQSHPNYDGPGWYRRHIDLTIAPGATQDLALLIPAIDDIYELY